MLLGVQDGLGRKHGSRNLIGTILPLPAEHGIATDALRPGHQDLLTGLLDDDELNAAALAEMVRVTSPGGRVVVFDTDHATVVVDSTEREINDRLMRFRLDTMFTNAGSGRQLYRLFRESGLADVTSEPRALASLDLGFARVAGATEDLGTQAIAAGVVTEEELGRWNAGLEQAAANGTFFCSWTMMLAAGRKP